MATARALADAGARVVFAARSQHELSREVAATVRRGGSALATVLDVTSTASVDAAVQAALSAYGRIDVLINNAGSGGTLARWLDGDSAQLQAMFDVHVFGAERVARAVAGPMRAQGGGTVVNVVSAVAWVPMPGAIAYSAAKAALANLSRGLRAELADSGIDVRLFAPPFTRTDPERQWPLERTKIYEREWVADELVRFLRGRKARALAGSGAPLLWLGRLAPALAARLVQGIGLRALAQVERARLPAGR